MTDPVPSKDVFPQAMPASDSPVTQQEIVSAINYHARELARLTAAWPAPEPETAPTAWMRGHRSYSPGEPDDYDVECVYGDDPPDDSGKWIPLYRRPAQPPRDGG